MKAIPAAITKINNASERELIAIEEVTSFVNVWGTFFPVVVVFSLTPATHLYFPSGKGFLALKVRVRL